ncbi:MAG: ABC transporter permease [Bacteroidota bacterium]
MNVSPPKWADQFLRWYCNPKYLEEIEGDIYELFERRSETKGSNLAKIKFVWDVFRFFRWSNINRINSDYNSINQLMLFRNYLKLGFRNIEKNLVPSSINIFGLAIAICFAISIFIFIDVQLNMDSFHTKSDRIYQITNYVEQDGSEELWSDSPITLGPSLLKDHSSVEAFTRVDYRNASVKSGNDVFDELTILVDPSFFEIFDFPLLSGDKKALYQKNQVVISKNMAIKYFSDKEPIGQVLSFKFSNGKIKKMTVGAVLDEYPYNSSIIYDFFIPFENFVDLEPGTINDWGYLTDATFILMKDEKSISAMEDTYNDYVALQNESDPEWKVTSFYPFPLEDVSTNSWQIVSPVAGGGHPVGLIALTVISLFLLGMACFNFMNIAVVSAAKRLKEIALRKVMGGVRKEIIEQFLVENLLQCFFALIIGALLSYFLLLPLFNMMVPEMDIQFRTTNPLTMVLFLVGLLLGVGLVSGAYPSFYISKFDTITIFKGHQKFGSKNLFSKVMLGLQFFLSVITIVGCLVFLDQSIYLGNKDWGYDPKNTMSIYVTDNAQYELLKSKVSDHPAITDVTASDYLIGRGLGVSSLEVEGRQLPIRHVGVSEGYENAFGLRLKEGRFISDHTLDRQSGVVINEKFVQIMGWHENAIGKTFTFNNVRRTVVGVVENFHYFNFFSEIGPVMFKGLEDENVHYLTVRTRPNQMASVEQFIRTTWQEIAPNDPFDRIFQEDVFDEFYQENRSNILIILLITGIAIVLVCLGLYGLLSFNIEGKLKEFSVRKVLGAKPKAIVAVVSKQYVWVLLIAFLIGAPLGSMGMMNLVIQVFPESKEVTALPFIVAMVIIVITLIMTVAGQIKKAIKVNPAELLRSE